MKHARLSPSGSVKWLNCSGAIALEAEFPNETSGYAEEGLRAHEIAAQLLSNRSRVIPEGFAELAPYIAFILSELDEGFSSNDFGVEVPVPLGHITGEDGAMGTADAIIWKGATLTLQVHDLKWGQGVAVRAQSNSQLRLYALGALRDFIPLGGRCNKVQLYIHQPRLGVRDMEELTVAELKTWGEWVKSRAKLATESTGVGDLNPGEHCRKGFCRARATCPALRDVSLKVVEFYFAKTTKANDNMDDLADVLPQIDMVEDWCKQVRSYAFKSALGGKSIPGWKLVQGRPGNRAWADTDAAEQVLSSIAPQDAYQDTVIKSPTKVMEWFKKEGLDFTALEGALVQRTKGALALVPDTDKRHAQVPTILDFDDLTKGTENESNT